MREESPRAKSNKNLQQQQESGENNRRNSRESRTARNIAEHKKGRPLIHKEQKEDRHPNNSGRIIDSIPNGKRNTCRNERTDTPRTIESNKNPNRAESNITQHCRAEEDSPQMIRAEEESNPPAVI